MVDPGLLRAAAATAAINDTDLTRVGIDGWDGLAIASIVFSGLSCVYGMYTIVRELRRHGCDCTRWTEPKLDGWCDL
jgi:hypothetical protein